MPPAPTNSLLALLFGLSIVSFVGSLIAVPWILIRLPSRYFDECHPRTWMKDHHPVLRTLGLVLKNLLGAVFVLAGIAMLVLPGQGLLTMFVGIALVDFPGKRALERKIIAKPMVLHAINRLRQRFNRPPLLLGETEDPCAMSSETSGRPSSRRNQPSSEAGASALQEAGPHTQRTSERPHLDT
jgi:hypothetical protein